MEQMNKGVLQMSEIKSENTITINEVNYNVSDFNQQQISLLSHVKDLEQKINIANFNMDQLIGSKTFFVNQLYESLTNNNKGEE